MAENERNKQSGGESNRSGGSSGGKSRSENTEHFPLEEREYQGKDGETHHHTNVWMERHGGEGGSSESGGSGGGGSNREGGNREGGNREGGSNR